MALLISLWSQVGSLFVISYYLERSILSIQSQASRLSLPRRSTTVNSRILFKDEELVVLDGSISRHTNRSGKVRVDLVAAELGRSIDSVCQYILRESTEDIFKLITLPEDFLSGVTTPSTQEKRYRSCLCCETRFVSEGKHNRMCTVCRSQSTADYSFSLSH